MNTKEYISRRVKKKKEECAFFTSQRELIMGNSY